MRSYVRRIWLAAAAGALALAPAAAQQPVDLPKLRARSTPGAEHRALEPLVGRWRVDKKIFVAMGTPDEPATSSGMVTERTWVANRHFLRDVTTGTVAGQPYERIGFLGYNPMDRATNGTPPTTSP